MSQVFAHPSSPHGLQPKVLLPPMDVHQLADSSTGNQHIFNIVLYLHIVRVTAGADISSGTRTCTYVWSTTKCFVPASGADYNRHNVVHDINGKGPRVL